MVLSSALALLVPVFAHAAEPNLEARRAETVRSEVRAERKSMDEIAMLMHSTMA